MSILITSATSAQAYKLKGNLGNNDVILGDFADIPAFMGIVKLPNPVADTYTHEMLTLCLDHGVETIYLLHAQEISALSLSKQLFTEYNINIINGSDNL